jgi:RNA polymerase sigma-70 factor (sigma-E family)
MPDLTSFAEFVHAHSRSLLGTAYLLTGDVPAAEDLVQDTLTKLLPKWAKVIEADAPVAYARKALVNTYLDSRRRRVVPMFSLEDVEDVAPGSADFTDQITDRDAVIQLLDHLPPRQRAAVLLRYLHDQDDAAIAAVLGCRAVTVRSLISRGLSTVRREFEHRGRPVDLRLPQEDYR